MDTGSAINASGSCPGSGDLVPYTSLQGSGTGHATLTTLPHPNLNRFLLPNGEFVACVFWNGLYHITGTDIG
jgi:hypothetical protein